MKSILWKGDGLGAEFEVKDEIPEGMEDLVEEYRAKLVEKAAEQDDEVLEKYFEGEEPDEATLKKLIRKGTLSFSIVPVLCGTAFKNKGVQPLLDTVGKDPKDEEKKLFRKNSDEEQFSGLAFKVAS